MATYRRHARLPSCRDLPPAQPPLDRPETKSWQPNPDIDDQLVASGHVIDQIYAN